MQFWVDAISILLCIIFVALGIISTKPHILPSWITGVTPGKVYYQTGDFDGTQVAAFTKLFKTDPKHPIVLLGDNLADFRRKTGDRSARGGLAKLLGPHDRTWVMGIPTMHESKKMETEKYDPEIANAVKKIKRKLRNGHDIVIHSLGDVWGVTDPIIQHSMGTGVRLKGIKSSEELKRVRNLMHFLQKQLDQLSPEEPTVVKCYLNAVKKQSCNHKHDGATDKEGIMKTIKQLTASQND